MGKKKRVRAQAAELDIVKGSGKAYGKKTSEANWKKPVGIIATVLVIVLIIGLFAWYYVPKSGIVQKNQVVMKTDNFTVTTAMCEYFFNNMYNNYAYSYQSYLTYMGLNVKEDLKTQKYQQGDGDIKTWYDYFMDSVYSQFSDMLVLCESAMNDKDYTIDYDAVNKEVDEALDSMREVAKTNNITLDYYFSRMYGEHADENVARSVLTLSEIAGHYQEELTNRLNIFTAADWDKYYEENGDKLLKVNYLKYEFAPEKTKVEEGATDDEKAAAEAKDKENAAKCKEYAEECKAVTTPDAFKAYVENYLKTVKYAGLTEDELEEDNVDIDALVKACETKGATNATESKLNDWLFDNTRKANETYVEEDDDGCFTVYMILAAEDSDLDFACLYRDTYSLQNYRYLKFAVEDGDKAEDVKKIATDVLGDLKENATVETFDKLANAEGASYTASNAEKADKKQVSEEVDAWVFDSARKEGDCELIEAGNAYYVVLYESASENAKWQDNANDALLGEAYDAEFAKLKESAKCAVEKDRAAISGLVSILDLSSYAQAETTQAQG